METKCIMCGKDIPYGGEWRTVRGTTLRPLCPDCNSLCAGNPDRVAADYPWLFDKSIPRPVDAAQEWQESEADRGNGVTTPTRYSEVRSLMNRYTDAYRVADFTVGVGRSIKVVGGLLAGILGISTMFLVPQIRDEQQKIALLVVGAITAGLVGALFFILGVLVSAQGQLLKASVDGAVNNSPFLTNEQRAKIMSI